LFQLRTGHVPLNKHLFRISKSPSPICSACHQKEESVYHFMRRKTVFLHVHRVYSTMLDSLHPL
ncbi:hypothetical protein BDR03DRAFT_858064, partial [Suillus americanus]